MIAITSPHQFESTVLQAPLAVLAVLPGAHVTPLEVLAGVAAQFPEVAVAWCSATENPALYRVFTPETLVFFNQGGAQSSLKSWPARTALDDWLRAEIHCARAAPV